MILDAAEKELLLLAGMYEWLPFQDSACFNPSQEYRDIITRLVKTGLLRLARSRLYAMPSPRGYQALRANGYDYSPRAKRPYTGYSGLDPRLEAAAVMLTCYYAGINTFADDVMGLREQPSFFAGFILRSQGKNLFGKSNCVGYGHFGDAAYMFQYVNEARGGMNLVNEQIQFKNMSSMFTGSVPAVLFAGKSYADIYRLLEKNAPSQRHGKYGFHDYGDAYRRLEEPVHLLSCDETGILQLAVMRQADYRAKIARAAFGGSWQPVDRDIPEADGRVDENPLLIGVDMDLRRMEAVISAARQQGRAQVTVVILKEQYSAFLKDILPGGLVKSFSIDESRLAAIFGAGFNKQAPAAEAAANARGGLFRV